MKIGLIGTGFWADQCHAAAIGERSDLEFVGLWGRSPEKTAELAARRHTSPFATAKELFEAVDIVSFAVPPDVQAELAPIAAESQCHLLLEKPTAFSSKSADRIAEACSSNGVQSVVNFSNLIAGSSGVWMRDVVIPERWDGGEVTIMGDLRVSNSPFADAPWRLRDNGALWDVGPHAVSLLLAALGSVYDVQGHHGRGDAFTISLLHEGGAVSTATLSYSLPAGASRFSIEFWGAGGVVNPPADPPKGDSTFADALTPALELLIHSIRTGVNNPCGARFGADVVGVLERAERSAADLSPLHDVNHSPQES